MNVSINADDAACGFASNSDGEGLRNVSTRKFENCYVGGEILLASNGTPGTLLTGFMRNKGNSTFINCHSGAENFGSNDGLTAKSTKDTIVSNIATADGWSEDNPDSPINNGYPVLAWQNTWSESWDGVSLDTEWVGSGTEIDPYLISTPDELAGLANKIYNSVSTTTDIPVALTETAGMYNAYTGAYFKLTKDIDLGNNEWLPIGRLGMRFNGTFDGSGHVVKNIKVTKNYYGIGLFGATGIKAVITDIGVENAKFIYSSAEGGNAKDYSASLNAQDPSWVYFEYMNTHDNRTHGTGALVGIVGGGRVERCFARNVTIENSGMYQQQAGGLLGGVHCTTLQMDGNTNYPTVPLDITDCYAVNVNISGSFNRVGGFMGSQRLGSTVYYNGAKLTTTNCYVANVTVPNSKNAFIDGSSAINGVYKNCFAVNANGNNVEVVIATKAFLMSNLITDGSNFTFDGTNFTKNGGFPILTWEAPWIYGEDTDLVSSKLVNMITGSQAPWHVFAGMNFMNTVEVDGVTYELDYLSQFTDLITNNGKVINKKDKKNVDITVFLHDLNLDGWKKETFGVTILPKGIELFHDGFDGDLSDWTVNGNITQEDSLTGYLNDKMLVVADGNMTRSFTEYNDSILNAVWSIYNDSDFVSSAIEFGGAVVSVSKTGISINGTETAITAPEGWFDVTVTANINTDEITVTIGENSVTTSFGFTTINSITIKEGNAKIDNLLVYESVPGELDALTEEIVLNGQNKFDVKNPLNLPTTINYHRGTVNVLWETSNADIVDTDGNLGIVEMTEKVTLTAKAYDGSLLGDGEMPSDEDILATKTFEAHVVPVGSTLLKAEDFNGVETEGMPITSYGWSTSSNGKWVKYTIERTPGSNPTDSFEDTDKVLKVDRFRDGEEDTPVECIYTGVTQMDNDCYEVSYDIYTTNKNHRLLLRLSSESGFISEVYMNSNAGSFSYCSPTVGNNGTWTNWNYKPYEWQNHKYIISSVDKTVKFYLDGELMNTVHYDQDGKGDILKTLGFGSQRMADKIGIWYLDNITVRAIMPEDSVAVSSVKDSLTVPETAEADIALTTDGKFGTDILWETSDADVIDVNGTVTRQAEEKTVTLTATIVKGTASAVKTFTVTVPATEGSATATSAMMKSIAEKFLWNEVSDESQFAVTQDLDLVSSYNKGNAKELGGVSVEWTTSDDTVIDLDGNVNRGGSDKHVVLTATLKKGNITATKTFKVYVPQTGGVTISDNFEDYDIGSDIHSVNSMWSDNNQNGGGHARVMYDGTDVSNKRLDIKRKTSVDSPNMSYTFNANVESTDILFTTMFKLKNRYDIINIDVAGIGQKITITPASIKVGAVADERTFKLNEWYQLTVYYNTAGSTYEVFLDAQALTESPVKMSDVAGITGITFSNNSGDKAADEWYIDEISVRDIAISDDAEAINAALREVNLATTTIEWNIEGLPVNGRYGVALEWISEKPEVLSNDGIVQRKVGESYDFKFIVRGSRNGVTIDKIFNVHVPEIPEGFVPTQEIFEKHMHDVPFTEYTDQNIKAIQNDINLPTEYNKGNAAFYSGATIEWSSDRPDVIDKTGKVIRPFYDEKVVLTAKYTSKVDPTITTEVEYPVVVWAECEVIFSEDFEDLPAEWESVHAKTVDERFYQEPRPQELALGCTFEKDVNDLTKSWDEANKAVMVERYRPSEDPERLNMNFGETIEDLDSLALSFDYMIEDSAVKGTVGFAESLFQPIIASDNFWSKAMRVPKIETKKWYTFTYVVMKSAGLVLVLRDGERVLQDYYYQSKGTSVVSLNFDIFRSYQPGKFYLDNVVVRKLSTSDEAAVLDAINALQINDGAVYEDLILNNTGINRTIIGYESSDTEVLSNDGVVTRPIDADRDVTLTAKVRRGGVMQNKVFNLTVKKADSYAKPIVLNSINGSGRKYTSVSLTNQTGYIGNNMQLVVLAYDKSEIVGARLIPIDSLSGTATVTFDEIDLSDVEYHRIEAYVVDGASDISNKKIIKY